MEEIKIFIHEKDVIVPNEVLEYIERVVRRSSEKNPPKAEDIN